MRYILFFALFFPLLRLHADVPPQITLYYSNTCPYSQQVLNYLKSVNKTVPMKNVKQDQAAKEELRMLGGKMEVPCLSADGTLIYGADGVIDWLKEHGSQLQEPPSKKTALKLAA